MGSSRRRRLLTSSQLLLPLLLLSVSLCLFPVESKTKWRNCSPKSAPVKVNDVEMSPDPPVSGSNFTLLLPSQTSWQLVGGSVLVSIYYFGVPIRTQIEDLCEKAQCPVPPGGVTFRHVQHLPYITPSGLYTVRLSAVDPTQESLFCTDVSLNVVRPTMDGQPSGAASSSSSSSLLTRALKIFPSLGTKGDVGGRENLGAKEVLGAKGLQEEQD